MLARCVQTLSHTLTCARVESLVRACVLTLYTSAFSTTGARITGVDDKTYSSTGESFSTIGRRPDHFNHAIPIAAPLIAN